MTRIEYLTAETERGRQAIFEVMRHSYGEDLDQVPLRWTLARLVDRVPVAWIQVDPDRHMDFPGSDLRYGFIMNVATREDRRQEGHFRALMEHALSKLRAAGISVAVTHGRYPLYRPMGFEVFTHHSGIFATPELIERKLGAGDSVEGRRRLVIEEHRAVRSELLLISDVKVVTSWDCAAALVAAAAVAREREKATILFEHPAAPSYGSRYPMYDSPETPLSRLALACGAEVRLQGADPQSAPVPDADWIKVLDAAPFVEQAARGWAGSERALPNVVIGFDTDAGAVSISSRDNKVAVSRAIESQASVLKWPSSALAQLVTGYQAVDVLGTLHDTDLSSDTREVLGTLFPPRWRFSRNESWTFSS